MCCQIFHRKPVAPPNGDFRRRPAPRQARGQDQEFIFFRLTNYYTASAAAAGLSRVCNLNEFSIATCFFGGASGAFLSTIKNLIPIYWFSKKLFFLYIKDT